MNPRGGNSLTIARTTSPPEAANMCTAGAESITVLPLTFNASYVTKNADAEEALDYVNFQYQI